METITKTTEELNTFLGLTAERIVAEGTAAERATLEILADAARPMAAGAAAALEDWDGSEIARLRAFGIVHGVLISELGAPAQAGLLARFRPSAAMVLAA
ncbi:hypothetical protein [Pseudarthrobacter sp. NS4]|uniref:hypothetical protein n=1 Tax=Pseudarthrobacter sp. NS4 TaxID=2973976 RepID=UPI002163D435|nr:hypothetical protein [Pseudarthrobacter sp. NS4]